MPKIIIQTTIKAPIQLVFDLSRSIDLHQISANETNEKAIAGRLNGLIELNETVTWKAKHFGIYQILSVKITEFDSPNFFVDEMIRGAFVSFRHKHHFTNTANDHHTVMTDYFEYKSPFGVIGEIANFIFLKSYMTSFLQKRNKVIKQYAESEKWKSIIGIKWKVQKY